MFCFNAFLSDCVPSIKVLLFVLADLMNVFESFLPQLLLYPNPSDPFNGEAASLLMRDRAAYEQKVKGKSHIFFFTFGFSVLQPLIDTSNLSTLKNIVRHMLHLRRIQAMMMMTTTMIA